MEVTSPESVKTVYDYEFVFSSGMAFPVTIDPSAGDSIEYLRGLVHINLAAKPSPSDPSKFTPAETHVIYLRHVASSLKRERTIIELNEEQKNAWKKAFQPQSKSIN